MLENPAPPTMEMLACKTPPLGPGQHLIVGVYPNAGPIWTGVAARSAVLAWAVGSETDGKPGWR